MSSSSRSADALAGEAQAAPTVAILLSLFNEEDVVAQKVLNFLQLDYPPDALTLAVGLDGCSDGTEAALSAVLNQRIRSFPSQERQGKTAVLNRLLAATDSDIVVFTDANAMFSPNAIRELVRPFGDPAVGLVSGRSVIVADTSDGSLHNAYYDWLTARKTTESASGSIVGADGAIYAMRRSLIEPLAPDFINDLTHPIQVVLRGCRAVVAPQAIALEPLEDWNFAGEFRRQVRMTAQTMHVCASFAPLLMRRGKGRYLTRLFLMKVLRYLAPGAALLLTVAAAVLAAAGSKAATLFCALALGFLLAAVAGLYLSLLPLRSLAYLLVVGCAYSAGVYKWLRGERFVTWRPRAG